VLYHLSSEDDYKLLRVTISYTYVYSLKSDMWRQMESTGCLRWLSDVSDHSVLLNEKLYFLKEDEAETISPHTFTYSVIKLDLNTGSYIEITTPFSRTLRATQLRFSVVRGCINILKRMWRGIEMWRMDVDGDWTKVVTYYSMVGHPVTWYLKPVHLMADGNWLMHHKGYLQEVDPEKPLSKNKRMWCMDMDTDMDMAPGGKYLETLISPNRYMK
jgi:hypothetical protein